MDKCTCDDVLVWYKTVGSKHFANNYVVVRALLFVPASQIKCKRVFAIAGQIDSVLRNRMGVDCLATLVFLYKNIDQRQMMEKMLKGAHGEFIAHKHNMFAACAPQTECAALNDIIQANEGACMNCNMLHLLALQHCSICT